VSESRQPTPPPREQPGEVGEAGDGAVELEPDALPVLAGSVRVLPARPSSSALADQRRPVIPAVQAAAVAAGGFVAGAAVVGLVHRRHRRSAALVKGRRRGRRTAHVGGRGAAKTAELVQIVSSRSLLLDVHLLGGPGDR
jgi:hypothetical protein